MKRLSFVVAAALWTGIPASATATLHPGFVMAHGTACVPGDLFAVYNFKSSQHGIHSEGSASFSTRIDCSLGSGPGSALPSHQIVVTAYDRHPTLDVVCYAYQVTDVGVIHWSAAAQTSGSGAGYQQLSFYPTDLDWTTFVSCYIPGASSGSFSHVTSILAY